MEMNIQDGYLQSIEIGAQANPKLNKEGKPKVGLSTPKFEGKILEYKLK